MTVKVAALLLLLLLSGCASAPVQRASVPKKSEQPSVAPTVHFAGRFAAGSACVIGLRLAVTAAHVPDRREAARIQETERAETRMFPYFWSDDAIPPNEGVASPLSMDLSRDLGEMCSAQPFATVGKLGPKPEPGDPLWVAGYDYRSKDKAYATRVWKFKLLRIVARQLILDDAPEPGSSGSCVFNAAGEVVGIMTGANIVAGPSLIGRAVALWEGTYKPPASCPDVAAYPDPAPAAVEPK